VSDLEEMLDRFESAGARAGLGVPGMDAARAELAGLRADRATLLGLRDARPEHKPHPADCATCRASRGA